MKPLLAGTVRDPSKLRFPLLASYKLDGVRALIHNGQVVSRNMIPIPNFWVQRLFGDLPEGLDGELIVGSPTSPDCFRKTTSGVMAQGGEPLVTFYVFDQIGPGAFQDRLDNIRFPHHPYVRILPHMEIGDLDELNAFEAGAVQKGYEGMMLRDPKGVYKYGRSTESEQILLKMKRFEDAEAEIVGFEELMSNTNAPIGKGISNRRHTNKEGMVGKNVLGAFIVRCNGQEFKIGSGFTETLREEYWRNRGHLLGKMVKFKFQKSDGKPRFPIFLGIRYDT